MAKNVNKDIVVYEQERRSFIDGLRNFHNGRGTPFDRLPTLEKKEVDLYSLYKKVTTLGGLKKVTDEQKWEDIFDAFSLPRACLNADQALKYIYIRYLRIYEQIHFLGEDPKTIDQRRRDDEGPIRKKHCGPALGVPLSYNYNQHDIAENLRAQYGLCTNYAKYSDYDKLEKALLSGLPNEVDFVINVCTLLSNESKHTLRLDRCTILTDLLLGHIGVFKEDDVSLEKLYENGWRKSSNRDFIRFWFDTIDNEEARKLISDTRGDCKKDLIGKEILQLGRNLGVEDKEGIRITQVSIIIRNLSFDEANMKYLANNDLVFRFLLLCSHCKYGTLRQLALDTLGNLAAQFILDPADSFKSKTILTLLVQCITSPDKFAVVRGMEMVSKMSRLEDNEFVLSEKLDTCIYEEIAKYLTIQDIQLIVSSLEALYQLSEIGEETNSKIAEVTNTVDTLVGLITVEAQSYGPNSLVGIKVVEYCPPPHLSGSTTEAMPAAVGPPPGPPVPTGQTQTPGAPGAQTPTPNKKPAHVPGQAVPANKAPQPPKAAQPMETTTLNWLQATYEIIEGGLVPHVALYTDYLAFCKRFQLTQPLTSQNFNNNIKLVFPRAKSIIHNNDGTNNEMCVQGIRKRQSQLPFSISCPVVKPRSIAPPVPAVSVAMSIPTPAVRPPTRALHSPTLIQRLCAPPGPVIQTRPITPQHTTPIYPPGLNIHVNKHIQSYPAPRLACNNIATLPVYATSGGIAAQGYVTDPQPPPINNTQSPVVTVKPKPTQKRKGKGKNPPILPRPDQSQNMGNQPTIMPKINNQQQPQQQQPIVQNVQPLVQNVQYTSYPQEIVYQTVDPQNSEQKVMVKTLLAQKIRQGNVIIQQPLQGVVNVDMVGGGDGQTVQYQTSYPQNVQQATYIQYTTPGTNTQTGAVQTLYQPNQTQTFVMQSGEVYVQQPQNQLSTSSLAPQMVTQQPIVMAPQQQLLTQQQVVSHQHVISQQQPQVYTQSQVISQSQLVQQSSIVPHQQVVIPTQNQNQIITSQQMGSQPQVQHVSSQMAYSSSPSSSYSLSVSSQGISSSVASYTQANFSSSSATAAGSSVVGSISGAGLKSDSASQGGQPCLQSQGNENNDNIIKNVNDNKVKKPNKPSNTDTTEEGEADLDLSSTEAVAEIESAVGSIMEEAGESMENEDMQDEEPVMIENDGNEMMFEQKYTEDVNSSNVYVADEAADAVGHLEQMESSAEMEEDTSLVINENGEAIITNEDVMVPMVNGDSNDMGDDQMLDDQMMADQNEINEAAIELESKKTGVDKRIIAKFSSETPIIVPIVSENGLFEQDFEARMAVENLLKDVEFNVNGEEAGSEENINIYPCQDTDNPGSVQTVSSLGDSETPICEDSQESVTPESQITAKPVVNINGTSVSSKSNGVSHVVPHNGITSDNEHKPLMNGNVSSPEYTSVPSPTQINGGDPKLVNGIISDDEKSHSNKTIDKVLKMNGVINHKVNPKVLEISNEIQEDDVDIKTELNEHEDKLANTQDILAQSMMDSNIDKTPEDSLDLDITNKDCKNDSDILAQSILENDIQPSDFEIADPEPTSVTAVVKHIIPSSMYGNIMTVQINNTTIPITFTNSPIINSKNSLPNTINVCNSRHIPTPESARDGELSCDSTTSSITTSDLNILISDKHSSVVSTSKNSYKDSSKSLTSPKSGDTTGKKKAKKRSRSKSGGSAGSDSRPSSAAASPGASVTPAPPPEYMCEWSQCRRCFDNAKSVFCHVCSVHLKTEFDGLCKWEGCESLVRKRWSLFTHVQDHHCSDNSLRLGAQRRLQSFQTGQTIPAPVVPAMVYPNDAAQQAIKRYLAKAPYTEFTEGREGPVTKHIRLTSALILRNVAKYSPAGRSLIKKHERAISYVCMSAVESSNALANCLYEILQDH